MTSRLQYTPGLLDDSLEAEKCWREIVGSSIAACRLLRESRATLKLSTWFQFPDLRPLVPNHRIRLALLGFPPSRAAISFRLFGLTHFNSARV
jgi:hypothetical protein